MSAPGCEVGKEKTARLQERGYESRYDVEHESLRDERNIIPIHHPSTIESITRETPVLLKFASVLC